MLTSMTKDVASHVLIYLLYMYIPMYYAYYKWIMLQINSLYVIYSKIQLIEQNDKVLFLKNNINPTLI